MSRSALALAHEVDAAKSSLSKASGVRVSHPGDASELEADRVADTVSQGGRIAGWSLSATSFDGVHRQAAPPQPPSLGDIAGKVAEALLATPAGKKALDAATAVVASPAGVVITGSTAIGVFTALDVAKKPLPAQLPAIPLDFIHPGLKVKLTWNGPVNQPASGSITISYSPKAAERKPAQSTAEKQRAENETMAADQPKFREGLQQKPAVGPVETPPQKSQTDQMFERWQMDKLRAIGNFAKSKPPAPAAVAPPVQAPAQKETPDLRHAPVAAPAPAAAHDDARKEEIPVQRKAEVAGPISTGSASVDSVLRSSGQPLDQATRRDMESRFSYDFSHVRLHTGVRAGESAQQLSAKAYTVGSNVVFAPGRFEPQTTEGRHLLAHELTHVVQQTTAPERAHPTVRPAPAHVQRAWSGADFPGASWVIEKLKKLRGYPLFCTIIGEDLFSGEKVERNATTLTQGVLGLFDGGPALFEKLQKAGAALETAYNWLLGELRKRKLTLEGFNELLDRAAQAVDKWHPFDSADRVLKILEEPLASLIDLAGVIAKKVLDFIFEAALKALGPTGAKVYAFFQRIGNVLGSIAADPLKFAGNLFKAVQDGFHNFGVNILTHLGEGVKTWIFEELNIKGVTIPTEFTFASMLKLVLQVLGLTYEQRRPQLVEKLGEPAVYFFETAGKVLARIQKEGFSAVWDMIKEQADKLFDSMIGSVKSWIVKEIVERGLLMVAKLANPAGEILQAVESIYETIEFIIEKAQKLVDLINTVVDALADIVAGNTGPAAQKVEDSLARTIPLILRFLAGQLHLTGIGKEIREIVDKIRKPIDDVIGKVLDAIVGKAKDLWENAKGAFTAKLDSIKEWWTKPLKFNYGDEEHELSVEGDGDNPEVMVHSDRTRMKDFLKDHNAGTNQTKTALELAKGLKWKDGKVESLSKKEAGYNNFVQLRDLMDHLRSKYPEKSQVNDTKPPSSLGSADSASAFLTPDLVTGSGPYKGPGPDAWEDLDLLLPPAEPHYVRGHLISEKLGGRGDWTNMMPLSNQANGDMERDVESKLKEQTSIRTNRQYYYYEVKAHYNESVKLPPQKNNNEDRMKRSKLAQSRLVLLSWTVKDAVPGKTAGKFEVTNKPPLESDGKTPLSSKVRKGSVKPNEP